MRSLRRRLFIGSLATILVTACAGFARAGSTHKSPERKASITFEHVVKLGNGATLPAGTYRMEVPEDSQNPTVSFLRDGKVVAKAPASLKSEGKKNPATEFDSIKEGNAQEITEIRPGGWREALHFSSAGH